MIQQDHQAAIMALITNHFDEASGRVDEVYETYFVDTRAVIGRHWRHKRDIPSDLVAPFKHLWAITSRKLLRVNKTIDFSKTGKTQEMEQIISERLLDLPGLLVAGLTTIAGFGSIGFSSYKELATMGQVAAIGVTLGVILSLTLVPSLLSLHEGRDRQ